MSGKTPASRGKIATSGKDEVERFLRRARLTPGGSRATVGGGRMIFSLDATMSRQPTWDRAQHLQAEMFHAAAELGGLSVQLVYYRGFDECRASRWVDDPRRLAELMGRIDCRGGYTQIGRVLGHIRKQAAQGPVTAAVHIGDACEENVDELARKAGEIALLGVQVFMFQEGRDPAATAAFSEIARITGGAHCRFDEGSAAQLKELLSALGAYAAGGLKALERRSDTGARLLLENLRR